MRSQKTCVETKNEAIEASSALGRKTLARVIAIACIAAVWGCHDGAAPPAATPPESREATSEGLPIWRVSRPNESNEASAYVLATVALRDTNRLRFDPAIDAAFEASARLVVPDDAGLAPQTGVILTRARLEEGDTLRNWLPADLHAEFTAALARAGYPPGTGDVTAPWFAALAVRGADTKRLGFVDSEEVEAYFARRAALEQPAMEVRPLETTAERYDRYVELDRDVQVDMLRVALDRAPRSDEMLPRLETAWRLGDAADLDRVLNRSLPDSPAARRVHAANVEREAARVADALADSLGANERPGDAFWVIPARLVVGETGLLARLEGAGFSVEQLRSQTGGAALLAADPYAVPPLPEAAAVDPERRRVLVVGIDGATLRVIEPLFERGRLPALASLAAEGASGTLRSHKPIHSPRIWASIATGKTPEHHGIRGFTYVDGEGNQQLYLSLHRQAHALWNIFSDAGLSVGVVNWWTSWPPEVVNGVMISDHAIPTRLDDPDGAADPQTGSEGGRTRAKPKLQVAPETTTYPREWAERVASQLADRTPLTSIDDPFLGVVGIPPFMQRERLTRRFRDDETVARIALDLDRAEAPDLLMVFLPGIDRVSHRLWGALEPPELYGELMQLTDSQRAVTRTALERYYEFTDALIGLLLARYGENDLVLVLSDHGFEGGQDLAALTGVHETDAALDGVLFARGPGIAPGSSTNGTSVNDVTPTVLAWWGLPLADDFDGQVGAFLTPLAAQPDRIATYDVGEIERIEATASGSEDEIMDRLRALGYIE